MRIVSPARKLFDKIVQGAMCRMFPHKAPGSYISAMSPEDREVLKQLTSEEISDVGAWEAKGWALYHDPKYRKW